MTNTSLIIVHYGDAELVNSLINSLRNHPDRKLISELIIVDNNGNESELNPFEDDELIDEIVRGPGTSYSEGVNTGVRLATGDTIIISNNDIEWISDQSISPAISLLDADDVGVVGPQQVFPDGSWQYSCGRLTSVKSTMLSVFFFDVMETLLEKYRFDLELQRLYEPEYIGGAFMCIDRNCFEELNGFDEEFKFYGEDADFCLRARQNGWRVVFQPDARIMHVGGASSSRESKAEYERQLARSRMQFVLKHDGERNARLFKRLELLVCVERILLYSLLRRLSNGEWDQREKRARMKYNSVKNVGLDGT